MAFTVTGRALQRRGSTAVPSVHVAPLVKVRNDVASLKQVTTDAKGRFEISLDERQWKEFLKTDDGYVLQVRTLGEIVSSNQSVLGDLGQGIHAFQDAISHKGVDFKHHNISADKYPPADGPEKATAAAYNGLLVFEVVSGDAKHRKLLKTTKIDVSTASGAQLENIKTAAQALLDNTKPDPDLVIRLHESNGDIELHQQSKVANQPDAGAKSNRSADQRKR